MVRQPKPAKLSRSTSIDLKWVWSYLRLFVAMGALAFGVAPIQGCSPSTRHQLTAGEMEHAATQFGSAEARVDGVELLLDTSGSMRGFALEANANRPEAADAWQSIFIGIDSLLNHFS